MACGLWTLSKEDMCVHVRKPVSGYVCAFVSPSATVELRRSWEAGKARSSVLSSNLEWLLLRFFAFGMKTVHVFQTNEEWRLPRQQHFAPSWQKAPEKGPSKVARNPLSDKTFLAP